MKTYKKTVEENRLVIEYDSDSDSPRGWSNLGYFITVDRNYKSPDNHEQIENIMKSSGDEAQNVDDHIQIMTDLINSETDEEVVAIYPIVKYEHSGISYSLGTQHGWDYSNNGFYIVTEKTQKEVGVRKEDFEKGISEELDTYNKWINGEVYSFTLYYENGEVEDSCCGFYDIEDIREYLPKEWKDEDLEQYLITN